MADTDLLARITALEKMPERVLDEFERHTKTAQDLSHVSVHLSLVCLQLVKEVSPDSQTTLRKLQALTAALELTEAAKSTRACAIKPISPVPA